MLLVPTWNSVADVVMVTIITLLTAVFSTAATDDLKASRAVPLLEKALPEIPPRD